MQRSGFICAALTLLAFSTMAGTEKHASSSDNTSMANVELSNVRDDLAVWTHINSRGQVDIETKEKISKSILRKIILVGTLRPQIDLLRGDALEALCLMTEPEGRQILNYAGDAKLVSLADGYLTAIEPATRLQVTKLQQTMKGTGCYITPKRPDR